MDSCPLGSFALEEGGRCSMKRKEGHKRKIGFLFCLMVFLIFLPGCWGKREVEELAPLIGIGIDLGQKPGTYMITQQLAKAKQSGAAVAEIEERTFSVEASSAREAYEEVYRISSRIPFMGSLRVVVLGEDAAKAGIGDILDFTQRYSEFRRSMFLVISKGTAQSLLNLKLRNGQLPAMSIKNHMEQGKNLSTFPTVRLGHYLTVLGTESMAPIIPVVENIKPGGREIEYKDGKEGEEIQIKGAGILRGDQLADFLTDEETKGYMWLENDVKHRLMNTVSTADNISFGGQILKSTTKYKVIGNDGIIGLHYQIKTSVAIDEIMGLRKKLSDTEWVDLMKVAETSFAKEIEKECNLSFRKEKELGLDFLGIGRHIEQKNSKYWKTVKDQWNEKIADFPVSLDIQVTIHHAGMSSSSAMTN